MPLTLTIDYGGVLLPQPIDREALWPQRMIIDDSTEMPMEESYLYSNRSYWYPQSPTLGYATAIGRDHCAFDVRLRGQRRSPFGHAGSRRPLDRGA